jgi:uncharacterized membrane protein YhdT
MGSETNWLFVIAWVLQAFAGACVMEYKGHGGLSVKWFFIGMFILPLIFPLLSLVMPHTPNSHRNR